eukprot:GHVT01079513.1.p1 GENE.GHVT01079513.1~~GHVT01079513.1.p1  ORF type:complete len:146 (+),score=25.30 GHVT01079513.1:293-730(+)
MIPVKIPRVAPVVLACVVVACLRAIFFSLPLGRRGSLLSPTVRMGSDAHNRKTRMRDALNAAEAAGHRAMEGTSLRTLCLNPGGGDSPASGRRRRRSSSTPPSGAATRHAEVPHETHKGVRWPTPRQSAQAARGKMAKALPRLHS